MRTAIALLSAVAALAVAADGAAGAVLRVNTTADGPGDCVSAAGMCTLREAIVEAKTGTPGEADTILLGPGIYENVGQDFIVSMDEQLTIVGAGARSSTVRETSGGDGRVFLVEQNASLTISDLTVSGSRDNSAVLLFGGGNAIRGARVTFSGNAALEQGGAIDGTAGVVELVDSALSNNAAAGSGGMPGKGGAIFSGGGGAALTLTNVTLSQNTAGSGSGVHVEDGQAALSAVTLAGNVPAAGAGAEGADLFTAAAAPPVRIAGSILGECAGQPPASLGHNLQPGTSCALAAAGDLAGRDPLLGPLTDNGGPTDTRALAPGSPAIDGAGACPPPTTDQRGIARPQGAACDVGAFEAPPAPAAIVTVPRLTDLAITPRTFRAASRTRSEPRRHSGARARGAARRSEDARRPSGARVRYRLNVAATVRVTVERRRVGRRAGGRCVAARKPVKRRRACVRWVRQPGSLRLAGTPGANAFRFRGRIAGRTLRPGRYRLVAVPSNGTATGRAARKPFRVGESPR